MMILDECDVEMIKDCYDDIRWVWCRNDKGLLWWY